MQSHELAHWLWILLFDIGLLSCLFFISPRVTLYTSVEMKRRRPATWPSTLQRFLQVCVVRSTQYWWPLPLPLICSLAMLRASDKTLPLFACCTLALIDKLPLVAGRSQCASAAAGLDNVERCDAGSRVPQSARFVLFVNKKPQSQEQCVV